MPIARDIKEIFGFQRLVGGGNEDLLLVFMQFLLGVTNIFELSSGDECITLWIYQKPWNIYF